ncbi:MATE family efflux transporter [Pseudoflavonifractor sp. 60]|nr:MATE family efflux transporter [Pseudoflavonifractor sp. 60]
MEGTILAQSHKSEEALTSAPIGPLMVKLALPAVAAQLINMLYNIVDRIYIGHIPQVGRTALTGLGVTFPILMLISAFTAFAGMGGAPLASIRLGAGDREEAEKILGNSTALLLILAALLTTVFSIIKEPVLMAFGASEDTIGYALDYISIYLMGTVFVQLALGLNAYITAQGQALAAMCSVLIGAILNILLDPLFIFVFRMGVRGAALATIISQGVSACWVVGFLCSRRSSLRIRTKNLRLELPVVGRIAALGIAPFIMQSTESLVTVVLNSGLQFYGGDLYVATVTVMQSVMQMVVMPVQGITQGVQPIMSYNFGAKNYARVRETFRLLLRTTLTVTISAFLLVFLFPKPLALIFNGDLELVELTGQVMPIFFGGIWAFGAQMACQSAFMAMGQAKTSLFLALLRKVILLVPLAILLPWITGSVMGIYAAEPVADILASATTLTLFLHKRKTLLPAQNREK